MSKTYNFNGTEFVASDNILRVHNAAFPLQKLFADKLKEFSAGVDIDKVNSLKAEVDRLEGMKNVDEEYLKLIESNPEQAAEVKRVKGKLKINSEAYEKAYKNFNSDEEVKQITMQYAKCIEQTFGYLITEDEVIIPFLKKYLTGDFSKLDFTDVNILKFISEIIADFFMRLSENKKKLNN